MFDTRHISGLHVKNDRNAVVRNAETGLVLVRSLSVELLGAGSA